MCDLDRAIPNKSFTGYKVVAVKKSTGRYYSIAMGFVYRKDGRVPVVKTQKRITKKFRDDILDSSAFRDTMVGRTAVFEYKEDAKVVLRSASYYSTSADMMKFDLAIKRAKVSVDLMKGSYGSTRVFAGRNIEFLD